ncbi:MAG: prepilin-type N-terminal cleavage/methylation domain-containing protein [Alphaproteobacteria bacterium]|nr:prepilin-type N-terminal cleavage/methylation domain-containing protein [Alphaproteobacteria bacterium]
MQNHGRLQAFSLVELSIVLVILGLLTGGILAGQSLIRASELRAVSTELQRWQTATGTFRDKYFAMAGDMSNATQFWTAAHATPATCITTSSTTQATCDGNGDGRIGGTNDYEHYRMWQHLANASLIEGTYTGVSGACHASLCWIAGTNVPRSKVSASAAWGMRAYLDNFAGDGTMFAGNYGNWMQLGAMAATSDAGLSAFKPEELWNIDTKMDDGRPAYGKIMARRWDNCTDAANQSDLNSDYALSTTSLECAMVVRNLIN